MSIPPTKLMVLSSTQSTGLVTTDPGTHQPLLADRSPPDPEERIESTTIYVGGTCRHSVEPNNTARLLRARTSPSPPGRTGRVNRRGRPLRIDLGGSHGCFQDARTSEQPWRRLESKPPNRTVQLMPEPCALEVTQSNLAPPALLETKALASAKMHQLLRVALLLRLLWTRKK